MALGKSLMSLGLGSLGHKASRGSVAQILQTSPSMNRLHILYPVVLTTLPSVLWVCLRWPSSFLWSISFLRLPIQAEDTDFLCLACSWAFSGEPDSPSPFMVAKEVLRKYLPGE